MAVALWLPPSPCAAVVGQGIVERTKAQARTRVLGGLGLGALAVYLWMYRDAERHRHPVRHSLVYGEPHGVGPVTADREGKWAAKGALKQDDGSLDATPPKIPSHVVAHYPTAGTNKHVLGVAWAGTERAKPITMGQHDSKHN